MQPAWLTRALTPANEPSSPFHRRFGQVMIWYFPASIGVLMGLATLEYLDLPTEHVRGLLAVCAGLAVYSGLIWYKWRWARQRPLALLFAAVAGFGAILGIMRFVVGCFILSSIEPRMRFEMIAGAVLFVVGVYYAVLLRTHPGDRGRGPALQ